MRTAPVRRVKKASWNSSCECGPKISPMFTISGGERSLSLVAPSVLPLSDVGTGVRVARVRSGEHRPSDLRIRERPALSIRSASKPPAGSVWARGPRRRELAADPLDTTRLREVRSEKMGVDIQKIKDQVLQYSDQLERVKAEVRKVLIGQDLMLSRLLIALSPAGTYCSRGCPVWPRPRPSRRWRRRSIASSTASSSRRTCCRPT